jgi:hypothetical protein
MAPVRYGTRLNHPRFAEPRTKEEWRAYIDAAPPQRPAMPTLAEYEDMSSQARAEFNYNRNAYHSAGALVRTKAIERLHQQLRRRMVVNRYQPAGARRGKVIDGPPNVGKSTLVKWFGADYEHELRTTDHDEFVNYEGRRYIRDYTPVVYVSVGAETKAEGLSIDFAEFLNVPYREASVKDISTHQILKAMHIAGTELVIIDELHFLDLSARQGKQVNDHLKDLANKTAATFIYTGVDLEASGIFLEGQAKKRGTQTAGRNDDHKLTPYRITTRDQAQEWAGVVAAMEDHTALYRHEPRSLARDHWRYLHQRTGGSIASLSLLIREAAVEAVLSGAEVITRELMDQIIIDKTAEEHFQKAAARAKGRRKPAAATRTTAQTTTAI